MDQSVVQKSSPPNAPSAYGKPPPTGIPLPHARVGTQGEWSTGLCDCFSDVSNCCVTCWCPCITFGQIADIIDRGSTCKRRDVFQFMRGSYESCGASGAIYTLVALVTGCTCIYSCFYRSRMRKQYMLSEDPCADCLVHFCCESCALCQEYRELKNRGFDMSLGWHGNVDKLNPAATMAPGVEGGMSR